MADKKDVNDTLREEGPEGVRRRLGQAKKYEGGGGEKPNGRADHMNGAASIELIRYSDMQRRQVEWLWTRRFALGKISLIVGHPGLGKSQVGLDIAARVSRGGPWPNGEGTAPAGEVIVLSAEDDDEDTILPRLQVAGADISKVHSLRSVKDGDRKRGFDITRDVAALEETLKAHPGVKMILIDPISAYLGMKLDSHNNTSVRSALQPLKELAQKYHVAIICITHLSKVSAGVSAAVRASGSIAFGAAARAVFFVVQAEQKDGEEPDPKRLFLPGKNNLAIDRGTGLSYVIVAAEDVSMVSWFDGTVTTTFEEAMGERKKKRSPVTDDVVEWIVEMLRGGPVPRTEISRLAEEKGIAGKTLRDARERLGVKVENLPGTKNFQWRLPADDELAF